MNRRLLFSILFALCVTVGVSAQRTGGGGGGTGGGGGSRNNPGTTNNVPTMPRPQSPNLGMEDPSSRVFYILGKVVMSDGSALTDRAAIQSNCRGKIKTEAYSDSKGNFSFQFGGSRQQPLSEIGPASDSSSSIGFPNQTVSSNGQTVRDCELQAVVPGFTSQVVDLGTKNYDFGHLDVGRIVVQRMVKAEGATIDVKVPESARKDYFKGLEEEQKGKPDSAKEKFQKAVTAYPQYASAWLELGKLQSAQNDAAAARQSFNKSIEADATLIAPYQELVKLAFHDKQWNDVADLTDKMIKLDSSNHPEFWYYNCVSKYYLGKTDEAQSAITQGIKLDSAHHLPEMEYVLGIILLQKSDRSGAAEHMHQYLALAPNGPNAADARKRLEEVEKASTETPTAKP